MTKQTAGLGALRSQTLALCSEPLVIFVSWVIYSSDPSRSNRSLTHTHSAAPHTGQFEFSTDAEKWRCPDGRWEGIMGNRASGRSSEGTWLIFLSFTRLRPVFLSVCGLWLYLVSACSGQQCSLSKVSCVGLKDIEWLEEKTTNQSC